MPFRVPAPDGAKGSDNLPILVLSDGAILKDRYTITGYMAAGGMSIVYSAVKDGEKYFIKEVEAIESKRVIALNSEKFILERLNHPGIVKSYDLFEQDGFYYLVLEYIEGEVMDRLISPFPEVFIQEKVLLNWALQLCDIFEYLHRQNPPVIYRDLKPKNLLKDRKGHIHLIDFGIARSYKQGKSKDTEAMGSAMTASPEHYGGSQTDERSDIFTLGATLHYFATNGRGQGEEPFVFAPVRTINPKLSENFEQVLRKALGLDPGKRYQNIREMRQALLNTREEPLPVLEPFGKNGQKAAAEKVSSTGQDASGRSSPEGQGAFVKLLAMALLFMVAVFIGVVIVGSIARPPGPGQVKPTPVLTDEPTSPAALISSPEESSQATFTISYGSQSPSPQETGISSPPAPTVFPSSSPAEKTPPPLRYTDPAQRPGATQNTEGPPGLCPENPPVYRHEHMSMPTLVPGEKAPLGLVAVEKVYRDESSNYLIVLPAGWRTDDMLLQQEIGRSSEVRGAFSHFAHPARGRLQPDYVLVVHMLEKPSGTPDPRSILQSWLDTEQKTNPTIVFTVNKASVSGNAAIFDLILTFPNGDSNPEIRQVLVGSRNVAAIRTAPLLPADGPMNLATLQENVKGVLDSFSFIHP